MPLWASPEDERDLSEAQKRELICEIGRRSHAARFNDANGGNITCRLDENRVLSTPTLISKGYMTPDDLVVLDMEGEQIAGDRRKTVEALMHLICYRRRSDVQAVVHAHPRHATAFAVSQVPLPKNIMPEVEGVMGPIAMTEYGKSGKAELAERLEPFIETCDVFILANHGAVTLGKGLIDAYWKMEMLDAFCETALNALSIGPLRYHEPERS